MVTQPVKPFLSPLVSSSALHCYVQQTSRGEVVFGGGSDPYPLYNTRSTLEMKESLIASGIEMFPFLAKAKLMRDLCVAHGIPMTIEDTWGGDINTAAIMHLVDF